MSESDDREAKRNAWRDLGWSVPWSIGFLVLGFVLIFVFFHTESAILGIAGLALLAGGFVQPLFLALFGLLGAYVWRPLWRYSWFQWLATAALILLTVYVGYVAFFTNQMR